MRPIYLVISLILLGSTWAYGQVTNDECVTAIPLDDITNWCSGPNAYSTTGATSSNVPRPQCFPQTDSIDIWFTFVAQGPNVAIGVTGATEFNAGGTLLDPQFALYEGGCNNLNALTCQSDAFNVNQVNAIQSELNIGQRYYIRVSARGGQTGSFELCVNNYNEVPPPDGDCPSAVVLCDKSPFTVDFVSGVGSIPNEIGDGGCGCLFEESSSTWYTWICEESGPLAFTLTPQNPADDLDFVLFELPNGIGDCFNKRALRCMASGENVGDPFDEWAPCTGETGLSIGDPDMAESCGCQAGNNNFANAPDLVAGRAYALVINNFSQSGAGFSIEFDQSPNTATFVGPEANFTFEPETACVGEPITFTDASTFIGRIESYQWDFGLDATPRFSSDRMPPSVTYSTPGLKTVVLEVTSERGCIVSRIDIGTEVICCADHFTTDADVTNLACPDIATGAIDFTVSNDYGPFGYSWSNGENSEDLTALEAGEYTVTVVDEASCEAEFTFTVDTPPSFAFDTLVVMPTCDGGTDGAVTLNVTGGTGPYQFNWRNEGFQPDNTLDTIGQGDYAVTVLDANGCTIEQVLPVRELELILDPAVQAIVRPSCNGFSDGTITIAVNNGLGPYQYNFNEGDGFGGENILDNITAGTYIVDVLDTNRCAGNFELIVEDHPPLTLAFDTENVSCFGESDGAVNALVDGGFGAYRYSWSNGLTSNPIGSLVAGNYAVTVLDDNDCVIIGDTTIIQPPELSLSLLDIIDNICFGESNGSATLSGFGGNPPYEFSADGNTFQMDSVLTNLTAGNYTFTILDALGCTDMIDGTIAEPPQLFVNAGPDLLLQLGFDTLIRAFSNYSPVTYEWSPLDSLNCLNADCSVIEVDPTSTTTYQVLVTNENGCVAVNDVTVRIINDRPVYVPNIFSPNNDGRNDGFTIYGGPALAKIEKLQVFSRWGSLVFEANEIDPNDELLGWDGFFNDKPVNPGVFVYLAQLRFVDEEVIQVEGDVTLVR